MVKKFFIHLYSYSVLYTIGISFAGAVIFDSYILWIFLAAVCITLTKSRLLNKTIPNSILKNLNFSPYYVGDNSPMLLVFPIFLFETVILFIMIFLRDYLLHEHFISFYSFLITYFGYLILDIILPNISWIALSEKSVVLGSGKIFPTINEVIKYEDIEQVALGNYSSFSRTILKLRSGRNISMWLNKMTAKEILRNVYPSNKNS